jgi:hypothetical protein
LGHCLIAQCGSGVEVVGCELPSQRWFWLLDML